MQQHHTNNFTPGINSKKYIILHHTGSQEGTTQGNINTCLRGSVSFHYLVNEFGDVHKFNDHDAILWHAGQSSWNGINGMNAHSIGIEVIGPLSDGGFTDKQKIAVRHLINTIMIKEKIPVKNLLRHADISPGRKTDIAPSFFAPLSWTEYQNTFISQKQMTEEQFKMFTEANMNDNSLWHQLLNDQNLDPKKRKELQDSLANTNRICRELGFGK